MTVIEKFRNKFVISDNGCWNWLDSLATSGYGRFWDGSFYHRAHRYSYELMYGKVSNKLVLDHLCRNRACVNPDHLEPVTSGVNVFRGYTAKRYCPQGHPKLENYFLNSRGHRVCRSCHNKQQSEYRRRRVTA